jgi:hypothetical protein
MRMIAMRLKQMDEMLQPIPDCVATATLTPSDAMAMASEGTHRGTRERSRREENQSSRPPMMRVAASVNRIAETYVAIIVLLR